MKGWMIWGLWVAGACGGDDAKDHTGTEGDADADADSDADADGDADADADADGDVDTDTTALSVTGAWSGTCTAVAGASTSVTSFLATLDLVDAAGAVTGTMEMTLYYGGSSSTTSALTVDGARVGDHVQLGLIEVVGSAPEIGLDLTVSGDTLTGTLDDLGVGQSVFDCSFGR